MKIVVNHCHYIKRKILDLNNKCLYEHFNKTDDQMTPFQS